MAVFSIYFYWSLYNDNYLPLERGIFDFIWWNILQSNFINTKFVFAENMKGCFLFEEKLPSSGDFTEQPHEHRGPFKGNYWAVIKQAAREWLEAFPPRILN